MERLQLGHVVSIHRWRGDHGALAGPIEESSSDASTERQWARLYALTIRGKRDGGEIGQRSARITAQDETPRRSPQLHQLVTEAHAPPP